MLTLLFGEDTVSSRNALVKIKTESGSLDVANWVKEQEPDAFLRENLSLTLLGGRRLLVFETAKWDKRLESPSFLTAVAKLPAEADVVVWVGGALTPANSLVKKVRGQGGKVLEFTEKVPRQIFPFLEAVAAKNAALALGKLQELLNSQAEPIFLVAMLAYELRVLLRVKLGATEGLNPFVVTKARRSAGRFSEASLVTAFTAALAADRELKSSQLPTNIVLTDLVLSIIGS
ncbi:MAG: hypothetical protein Q8N84_03275 [bacterium]|nr:hypothetical protein [bacterium]